LSPRTAKTVQKWLRYVQNSIFYCFDHISTNSYPFWMF
jgi:hypothetical protein